MQSQSDFVGYGHYYHLHRAIGTQMPTTKIQIQHHGK